MESVPEENNQPLNDRKSDEGNGGDGKYVFSTLDVWETVGFVVFEGAGFALHEAGFHVAGFIADFLGAWCGLLVLRHRMQHSKLEKFASVSFWSILFAAFLFFSFLSWSVSFNKSDKSTPHLRAGIKGKNESIIWLTNDLLTIKDKSVRSEQFHYVLVLPVNPISHSAQITFLMQNDGNNADANSAQIIFFVTNSIFTYPESVADLRWDKATDNEATGYSGFSLLMPHQLPPVGPFSLPTLHFQNLENQLSVAFFSKVITVGTGIPQREMAFWTIFRTETNIDYPQFIQMNSISKTGSNMFRASVEIIEDVPKTN